MTAEEISVRKFMLKKFPTNKWMDCPIPQCHWETIQEYAEEYASLKLAESKKSSSESEKEPIKWCPNKETDVSQCKWYGKTCFLCDYEGKSKEKEIVGGNLNGLIKKCKRCNGDGLEPMESFLQPKKTS